MILLIFIIFIYVISLILLINLLIKIINKDNLIDLENINKISVEIKKQENLLQKYIDIKKNLQMQIEDENKEENKNKIEEIEDKINEINFNNDIALK